MRAPCRVDLAKSRGPEVGGWVGVQPQGAVGAVGIHADGHPLLTVDKPRPVVRVWSAGTHVASLGSGKEQRDGNGKGTVARPGRIRMPAARFANTRPRVSRLFCQPGIKPCVHISRGGRCIFATTFLLFFLAQGIFTFVLDISLRSDRIGTNRICP